MRIVVHDFAGHPFQFELSRELAKRGHFIKHIFFANDPGPKGSFKVTPDDPPTLSIEPIELKTHYAKNKLVRRYVADHLYGRLVSQQIAEFKPDIVISGNAPLDVQRAVQQATIRSGAKFTFWVQDFFGIGIERVLADKWYGVGKLISKYYRAMEAKLLERSDAIVLISPDFVRYLPTSIAGRDTIRVIRNWGALNSIRLAEKANPWAIRHGLVGKTVFMYTGTLGLKHDPGLLIRLSEAFLHDEDVMIVVVASGVSAETLRLTVAANPRQNLKLLPLQPMAEMSDMLGSADVLIAVLEGDAAEFSVPSKLLSYLCAGKPILLSAPSRNLAVRVLEESGAGLHVEAADEHGFLMAASRLREDTNLRIDLGKAGRIYATSNFDIELVASRFEVAMGFEHALVS